MSIESYQKVLHQKLDELKISDLIVIFSNSYQDRYDCYFFRINMNILEGKRFRNYIFTTKNQEKVRITQKITKDDIKELETLLKPIGKWLLSTHADGFSFDKIKGTDRTKNLVVFSPFHGIIFCDVNEHQSLTFKASCEKDIYLELKKLNLL